jgi:hypothetical protein
MHCISSCNYRMMLTAVMALGAWPAAQVNTAKHGRAGRVVGVIL